MDNNNSIPYGAISWDNEDSFPPTNQRREAQGVPTLRPPNSTGSNGLRYSLRGPHFPPPQQRLEGVGISRNLELANRLQGETPQSNFQQPSSPSSPPYERYFSLRPSRSTSHIQMHTSSLESQPSNSTSNNENQTLSTLYADPSPGSSSSTPGTLALISQHPNFSATSVHIENAYNNNVEMSQGLTSGGSHERFHASKVKRKSSLSESDEGQDGPSRKQFLSEERMAARMHNLRISNDHNYPVNIMQRFMDHFSASQEAGSQINEDDDEFEDTDETERRDNFPVFVLSSHVKDAVSKTDSIIPEAIFNQLSKPCLAVVPWKGPDDRFSFSTESKPNNQDKTENQPSSSSSSSSSSLGMESTPETEQFQDKGVHHVEIVGECSTFTFEDDDMEQ